MERESNTKFKFLFFLVTLLFTLRSYYFYSISLAPAPVLAAAILVFMVFFFEAKVNEKELFIFSILIFIFSFSIFPTLFSDSPYINSFFGLIINLLIFFTLISMKNEIKKSFNVINYVLLIHVIFFFIQFLSYYFFGEKVDFLEPITGETQRMSGYERIEDSGGLAIFRPSGLFSEPSSYCVFLITLLWIIKKSDTVLKPIEILTLTTILLSFSLSGIIFAVLYIVLNYFKKFDLKLFTYFLLFMIIFMFLSFDYFQSYYEYRVLNMDGDNSANERLLMFTLFFDLPPIIQFFGSGVGNDLVDIPLTTVPSLLVYLGVFGTLSFFYFICISFLNYKVDRSSILFLLFITFNFYKISNPYVWFFYTLLLIVSLKRFSEKGSYES